MSSILTSGKKIWCGASKAKVGGSISPADNSAAVVPLAAVNPRLRKVKKRCGRGVARLTRLPVTEETAGSNPVGRAINLGINMKEFLKDNWFKIIIAVMAITVGLSIGYYFIFYLPNGNKNQVEEKADQEYVDNQIKCQKAGNEQYKKDVENNEKYRNPNQQVYSQSSEFKFNKELNTCLYKVETITVLNGVDGKGKYILDVYSNKLIFGWFQEYVNNEWEDSVGTELEWNKKYSELFGN